VTWEERVVVHVDRERTERLLKKEYSKLLQRIGLNGDPLAIDGKEWMSEKDGITSWPQTFFVDVSMYLQNKMAADVLHQLSNDYKEGKAFR
jgi:hypothetical protein